MLQQIFFLFNFALRYFLISYIRGIANRTPPGDRPEPSSPYLSHSTTENNKKPLTIQQTLIIM
nr:MAG TPA: hypothetical protein [Caudoviricetes sp.]DAO78452.1 MAG TPA: hypothetical protein [Caudoviricetes sp.]DAS86010.1 MAG TPA: hypothetical protein [Caudoviricetes sp.]